MFHNFVRTQLLVHLAWIARGILLCLRAGNNDLFQNFQGSPILRLRDCSQIHLFSRLNKNASSRRGRSNCSAVPPLFPANGGALCDWQIPVLAVTGNPVPFYSHTGFLRQSDQATSALFPCGCFHRGHSNRASFSIRFPGAYYS
jgi:hypothetical protein